MPECEAPHKAATEKAVLDLHDQWIQFMREYFVSSASRHPMMASGLRVQKITGSVSNTYKLIRRVDNRNPDGSFVPKWHYPNEIIRFASRLNLANSFLISSVLGDPSADVLNHLTAVRNYIAHRNRSAKNVYEAFLKSAGLPPANLPADTIGDRTFYGQPMMEHWVNVLEFLAVSLS